MGRLWLIADRSKLKQSFDLYDWLQLLWTELFTQGMTFDKSPPYGFGKGS
jgi:hypothetical protein